MHGLFKHCSRCYEVVLWHFIREIKVSFVFLWNGWVIWVQAGPFFFSPNDIHFKIDLLEVAIFLEPVATRISLFSFKEPYGHLYFPIYWGLFARKTSLKFSSLFYVLYCCYCKINWFSIEVPTKYNILTSC